ncbi:MAG: nitroreductase, partial [Proteobacteria bacterium]|nr:nitroreductase [Pseudomonadota bacterium]
MWRSGWACFHPEVLVALGLSEQEKLVGYIYIGTPQIAAKDVPELDSSDYVVQWN